MLSGAILPLETKQAPTLRKAQAAFSAGWWSQQGLSGQFKILRRKYFQASHPRCLCLLRLYLLSTYIKPVVPSEGLVKTTTKAAGLCFRRPDGGRGGLGGGGGRGRTQAHPGRPTGKLRCTQAKREGESQNSRYRHRLTAPIPTFPATSEPPSGATPGNVRLTVTRPSPPPAPRRPRPHLRCRSTARRRRPRAPASRARTPPRSRAARAAAGYPRRRRHCHCRLSCPWPPPGPR